MMNKYAMEIRDRWQAMAPASFAGIEHPEEFFSELGETVLTAVDRLTPQLVSATPHPDYLVQAGTLATATRQAEEIAMDEVPWPAPELDADEARQEWESTRPQESGLAEWMAGLDRPLMEHELQDLSERWILSPAFLQEWATSPSPMTYLDSHSAEISKSQELRYARSLQEQ